MIEIFRNSGFKSPAFHELLCDSDCFVLEDLDKSSTKRVWIVKMLLEEMQKLSHSCILRIDNWGVWESGCYMPLFNSCWSSLTQSSGLSKDEHILHFHNMNTLEFQGLSNLVMIAYLFAWDVIVYTSNDIFFALSHDDELIIKGMPNAMKKLS